MEIAYRHIRENELDALLGLHKHLFDTDDPLPDAGRLQQVWQEIIGDPKIHYLVADVENKIVAACILVVIPNLTRGTRSYALVENVVTHADFRKRGIGSGLMKYAQQVAWDNGCYKVMLATSRQRDDIYRFYENTGFIRGTKTAFIITVAGINE